MKIPLGTDKSLKALLKTPKHTKTAEIPKSAGVYLWTFENDSGETLFYVGRAKNLAQRIGVHMDLMYGTRENIGTSPKHSRAARKYRDSSKLYILELVNPDHSTKDTLEALERFWILYFWKLHGSKLLLNVEIVPNKKKFSQAQSAKMSKLHRERFAKDPNARKLMADKVKEQWKDPEFRAANKRRSDELRSTGWAPTPIVLYKVKLPNGNTFVVPRKELAEYLGIGCRSNGFLSFFSENRLLSDWKVSEYLRVSGKDRQKIQHKIDKSWQAFLADPFITWFSALRAKLGKCHWARGTPISFEVNGAQKKTFFTTAFRKSGKILVPNGKYISKYETLYEFACDRVPIHY